MTWTLVMKMKGWDLKLGFGYDVGLRDQTLRRNRSHLGWRWCRNTMGLKLRACC